MSIQSLRQGAGKALMALSLGLGLAALHTSCAKNDSGYIDPAPAISYFRVALADSFTKDTATNVEIVSGSSAWFRANFGVKDGSAVLNPGNLTLTSNVPVQISNITATTTYTLTVTSGDGKKATSACTVTVLVPPSGLTYTNEDATYYKGVQIVPNTVATISGAAPIVYSLAAANPAQVLPNGLSLNPSTGAITGTPGEETPQKTYTIQATRDPLGNTIRAIKLTVAATPLSFSAAPSTITVGLNTTLSWDANTVPGVFSTVTITATPTDLTLPATFALAGTANVAPLVTTTYTLSATPAGGGAAITKLVDVTVGAAPVTFTSFTATPKVVPFGSPSTLAWSYTGTALDLSLDGASVLGSLNRSVTPYGRQTYTLAGSNLIGADTTTVKVGAKALYHVAGSFGAGRGNVDGGVDANGLSKARFYRPNSIAWDEKANDGSMIVCDYSSNLVRRIAADRTVTTIAGTPGLVGVNTDNTTLTKLLTPRNAAVDPVTGDVYVGGEGFNTKRLLKLTPNGDGTYTPSLVASFALNTNALVIDANRMMYFVEFSATTGNFYKMDLTAGTPTPVLVANLAPTVNNATAMAKDFNGGRRLLYVVGLHKIIKIDISTEASPVATLITGTGVGGFVDSLSAATGTVNGPQGVAVDTAGNVYIADRNNFAVRMIPATGPLAGALITIAGKTPVAPAITGTEGYAPSSLTLAGTATLPTPATACLSNAYYVAVQGAGAAGTKIFVADAGASFDNQAIRVITVSGTAPTLTYTLDDAAQPAGYAHAGAPRVTGNLDGLGAFAKFNFGTGSGANLATLPDGSLTFAADTGNNAVRVIAANGAVTTLKDASSANFTFTAPKSIAVQVNPTTKTLVALLVGDAAATKKIRKFTPNAGGTYTEDVAFAITGGTFPASVDAQGLAVGGTSLYVTDGTLARLFKVDLATGTATDLVAATGTKPMGVALQYDSIGTAQAIWVAVSTAAQVKKFDLSGTLLLTVGTGTAGYADGAANAATFTAPTGLAVDGNGFVYVNNYASSTSATTNGIRAIDATTGAVTSLFGSATSTTLPTFFGMKPGLLIPENGGTTGAKSMNGGVIYAPQGLTINQDGDLLVSTPHSVYKVVAPATK